MEHAIRRSTLQLYTHGARGSERGGGGRRCEAAAARAPRAGARSRSRKHPHCTHTHGRSPACAAAAREHGRQAIHHAHGRNVTRLGRRSEELNRWNSKKFRNCAHSWNTRPLEQNRPKVSPIFVRNFNLTTLLPTITTQMCQDVDAQRLSSTRFWFCTPNGTVPRVCPAEPRVVAYTPAQQGCHASPDAPDISFTFDKNIRMPEGVSSASVSRHAMHVTRIHQHATCR